MASGAVLSLISGDKNQRDTLHSFGYLRTEACIKQYGDFIECIVVHGDVNIEKSWLRNLIKCVDICAGWKKITFAGGYYNATNRYHMIELDRTLRFSTKSTVWTNYMFVDSRNIRKFVEQYIIPFSCFPKATATCCVHVNKIHKLYREQILTHLSWEGIPPDYPVLVDAMGVTLLRLDDMRDRFVMRVISGGHDVYYLGNCTTTHILETFAILIQNKQTAASHSALRAAL